MYPQTIARCQHLKVNGTQCGSPALRNQLFCYFHQEWRQNRFEINPKSNARAEARPQPVAINLPVLEDANSIQVALMQVMRLLLTGEIEHRTAGLLLYAMQTASANLARTSFEPAKLTRVVIDQDSVAETPLGATQWSAKGPGQRDDENETDAAGQDSLAKILIERMGLSGVAPGTYKLPEDSFEQLET